MVRATHLSDSVGKTSKLGSLIGVTPGSPNVALSIAAAHLGLSALSWALKADWATSACVWNANDG